MYLKKIEISGFKSFAQKTILDFLPARNASLVSNVSTDRNTGTDYDGQCNNTGLHIEAGGPTCEFKENKKSCGITAIVGPNGSGKSNVADAIRWTMGEQSMKNLRGKKSEDVIFAGSGKKARLGSASVTLHFDNYDKKIPLEFSEVTITRKLFRSGDSEYIINGSRVRLVDIIDLLAKAGIGRESYCVINQGMSDAVLSASPSERKVVLEDAAGVKQYQIKKERALRKLESTQENLERVSELINEIEPHLRMLKRQADKAQKGKELMVILREKQLKLFSYLWHIFQAEKDNSSAEKNNLGAKMMNAQREVDKIGDELNKESKEAQDLARLEALEKKREELRERLNSLEKDLVIAEGRLEIEKEKKIQREIIENIPVDLGFVREKLGKIRQDQEKLIQRLEGVENISELQELREFARVIGQELFDLHETAGKGNVEIKKDLSGEVAIHAQKITALAGICDNTRKKIESQKKEVGRAEGEIRKEDELNRQKRQKFFELEKLLREKQNSLGIMKDQFNEAKINLAKIEVREEDLAGQIKEDLKMDQQNLKYDGAETDKDSLEKEISKIKIQLEQAGGIDPLVVEEYEETRKRHEFLVKESKDLKNAVKSCREVIKEMDERIKKVFDQAFEQINGEFTKYFRIIFGGGNAHLIKSKVQSRRPRVTDENLIEENKDSENIEDESDENEEFKEEIGIDISACPPGKKIANLNMLSGGERSLTSLALLFAIISHNPPPFAVLDEVEAALDEANSRRFGRIIQELSSDTQFVIITHNRETMRQASLLYGVTMGEDGVSKLLSVKLDQVGQNGQIAK